MINGDLSPLAGLTSAGEKPGVVKAVLYGVLGTGTEYEIGAPFCESKPTFEIEGN